ncbi:type II toxin-antitoxin system HicB family antitoxin [Scytonema millei]|uniref:Type II toxin-antitoxin system HicB family antitoxin n=1 Tax=Scytonema millei VB511283 TaxID=1245923 RepID=A0A9X5I481_9CYAN|nr:type II toxin-antitoxin system HicB family antitoxin [Scytonema millei]NHC34319.1 type II toxin-antitoxin system HicB family antitoxin [Scytonema millei VB511283]
MKFTITIHWSEEDNCYVVYLPEFKDFTNQPATHGETYEEALSNAKEVLEMLIEEFQEEGKELPQLMQLAN